ncbi:unnamed protein product, partial [Tetraodon nigroviridis]
MSDEDSRASTSSSSSTSSGHHHHHQQQQQQPESAPSKKRESKASMSKTSKLLSTSAKRIQKELADITLDPPPNCRTEENGTADTKHWAAFVLAEETAARHALVPKETTSMSGGPPSWAPPGSVYEGGVFFLDIAFTPDYPFKPPK